MMKKKIVIFVLFFFFLSAVCLAQQIRKPVASGSFYPDSAPILAERIKQFLGWAEPQILQQDILAIIVPHAGYDYSGSVAAYAFKGLKQRPFKTVVIIGSSHFEYFDGISVYPQGAWQTPLGNVSCDSELANQLIQGDEKISFFEPAFSREHSLEVELPFLQIVLDDFKIVPIVMGKLSFRNCQVLAQALVEAIGQRDDVLVVASTDLSHYHSYEQASKIDRRTINTLEQFRPQTLYYNAVSGENELCAAAAVITAMLYAQARGAEELSVLKYANSGDVTGDRARVVGYLSAVIYAPAGRREMASENTTQLNTQQKTRLLEIARKTINEYVRNNKTMDFKEDDPLLREPMGAFVTIRRQGSLRGCIGNIVAQGPLYLTVRDMAIQAATNDPRFPRVSAKELGELDIEISVLSQPQRVKDVREIQMGTHGVIVKKGFASGVFLPQVATETGWSREEFLSSLCSHKAGLSADAWQDKDTELYSFSAQVFCEDE